MTSTTDTTSTKPLTMDVLHAQQAAAAAALAATPPNSIVLDTPIHRAAGVVTMVTLRKPKSGELRGVSLSDILQLDVNALQTVLPRITTPMLLKQEVADMDPADLVQIGTVVAGFLLPKASMEPGSQSA